MSLEKNASLFKRYIGWLKTAKKSIRLIGFVIFTVLYVFCVPGIYFSDVYNSLSQSVAGFTEVLGESGTVFFYDMIKDNILISILVISFSFVFMCTVVKININKKINDRSYQALNIVNEFFLSSLIALWFPICFYIFSIILKWFLNVSGGVFTGVAISFFSIFLVTFLMFSRDGFVKYVKKKFNVADNNNDLFNFKEFGLIDHKGEVTNIFKRSFLLSLAVMIFTIVFVIFYGISDAIVKYKIIFQAAFGYSTA
ncbi:hypothetical protein [Vibrio vulnificus]|uniref:hypothetical protein n=2 Tax=Vibrio TaxID=662 RepID=UPI0005F233A7|nr:hypothetical protein [Vibrio vulnificus]